MYGAEDGEDIEDRIVRIVQLAVVVGSEGLTDMLRSSVSWRSLVSSGMLASRRFERSTGGGGGVWRDILGVNS